MAADSRTWKVTPPTPNLGKTDETDDMRHLPWQRIPVHGQPADHRLRIANARRKNDRVILGAQAARPGGRRGNCLRADVIVRNLQAVEFQAPPAIALRAEPL